MSILARLHFKQHDLFMYFKSLGDANKLPSFGELEAIAKKLFRAYSSHRAAERALYHPDTNAGRPPGEWERTVPLGEPWPNPSPARSEDMPYKNRGESQRLTGSTNMSPGESAV